MEKYREISSPLKIEPDNRELISRLIEGESDAGRIFFNRYHKLINRLVWRLLGADSEHDDLVQEVFMAAVSSIEKLRDPDLLESWITSIAVNLVRKEIRKRKIRRLFVIFTPDNIEVISEKGNPEATASVKQLYRLLDGIDADDRIAFILCMIENMTQLEAAQASNCSLSTLKRRLGRATDAVEKFLNNEKSEKRKGGEK